ncbi:MAG: YfhO family protein, partial [Anaerolineae bacterium]|nr:YfhO family protein [Anaerolineae bacterium]
WMLVALVVVAADLIYAAQGLNPTVPASFFDSRPAQDTTRAYWPQAAQDAALFTGPDALLRLDDYRVAVTRQADFRTSGLPDVNLLDRRPLLNNFDPLLAGHFAEYIMLLDSASPEQQAALLQAAGVGAIYTGVGQVSPLDPPAAETWLVDSVCWHPAGTSLRDMLLRPGWNPLAQVNLIGEGDCPPVEAGDDPPRLLTPEYSGSTFTVTLNNETGGWLVLVLTDYPGWYASVDGQPATLYRANGAFQAVQIPAGAGRVTLNYHPWWLWPGMLVSFAALLLTLLLFRSRDVA